MKVTKGRIDSKIRSVDYFQIPDTTCTICNITLLNGFSVRGESACADPSEFNLELGKKYSYENAYEKIWMLEGYLLKQELYEAFEKEPFEQV